jgi:hypothetical protein
VNNGLGTGVYFSIAGNISQSIVSGSVLSFKLKKSAEKKAITDGSDAFQYIGITKRMKVANVDVLFTGSGSKLNLPNIGDTALMSSPWTDDVSGSWAVTESEVDFKSDDAAKVSYEITQWFKADGTTLP